jgi:nitrogen fixation protein NifU and related proteins
MNDTDELYQQVILEHNRHPRHFYELTDCTHQAEGHNPLCGDHYHVFLCVSDGGTIEDISFTGTGCAISKASLSIMTDALVGKSVDQAKETFEQFHQLVLGQCEDHTGLGKLTVFEGVAKFPTRVKCAVLGWHTLVGALDRRQEAVLTE